MADVLLRCYGAWRLWSRPDNEIFCRIFPWWGNSGSIYLEALVAQALSETAGQMSRKSVAFQYNWEHPLRRRAHSYLYPVIDEGQGYPAGPGPCMEVTRAQ